MGQIIKKEDALQLIERIQENTEKLTALAHAINAVGYCRLQSEVQNRLDYDSSDKFENYMEFDTRSFSTDTLMEIIADYKNKIIEDSGRIALEFTQSKL